MNENEKLQGSHNNSLRIIGGLWLRNTKVCLNVWQSIAAAHVNLHNLCLNVCVVIAHVYCEKIYQSCSW